MLMPRKEILENNDLVINIVRNDTQEYDADEYEPISHRVDNDQENIEILGLNDEKT